MLKGGRIQLRANGKCRQEAASNHEQKRNARRRALPIMSKSELLEGRCAQSRSEDADMHPSGVQFGLSRGLLQLRGEEVLLSDQLLEAISLEAQLHLHLGRPPIDGNFLVDITVRAAQALLQNQPGGRRQEVVPFFASLNRTMYYTFCRVAERAGLAHKEPRRVITNPEFWPEFSERVVHIKI